MEIFSFLLLLNSHKHPVGKGQSFLMLRPEATSPLAVLGPIILTDSYCVDIELSVDSSHYFVTAMKSCDSFYIGTS
jgi:hypothetical protein